MWLIQKITKYFVILRYGHHFFPLRSHVKVEQFSISKKNEHWWSVKNPNLTYSQSNSNLNLNCEVVSPKLCTKSLIKIWIESFPSKQKLKRRYSFGCMDHKKVRFKRSAWSQATLILRILKRTNRLFTIYTLKHRLNISKYRKQLAVLLCNVLVLAAGIMGWHHYSSDSIENVLLQYILTIFLYNLCTGIFINFSTIVGPLWSGSGEPFLHFQVKLWALTGT